jgi:F0F1-type ATP synthase delta subunit
MNASVTQYAKALLASKEGQESAVVTSFLKMLDRRGERSKAREVLEALEKEVRRIKGEQLVTIEVAALPTEANKALLEAKAAELFPGKKVQSTFTVIPELVAGYRIRTTEMLLDASAQTRISKLSQTLTSTN